MPTQKLIVANWKMNGSLASIREYGSELAKRMEELQDPVHIVVAPPFPYLMFMAGRLVPAGINLAAQDCSAIPGNGAYTGDVSAAMLKDIGCRYVIVGHSERRHHFHDDNATIAEKVKAVLSAGLIPILCVGETLAEKEAGKTEKIVKAQLDAVFKELKNAQDLVIAYEPVWSIGTGQLPTTMEIRTICSYIQAYIQKMNFSAQVLYGGSVNGENARDILHLEGIDGLLVGGASLTVATFWPIVMAASS